MLHKLKHCESRGQIEATVLKIISRYLDQLLTVVDSCTFYIFKDRVLGLYNRLLKIKIQNYDD